MSLPVLTPWGGHPNKKQTTNIDCRTVPIFHVLLLFFGKPTPPWGQPHHQPLAFAESRGITRWHLVTKVFSNRRCTQPKEVHEWQIIVWGSKNYAHAARPSPAATLPNVCLFRGGKMGLPKAPLSTPKYKHFRIPICPVRFPRFPQRSPLERSLVYNCTSGGHSIQTSIHDMCRCLVKLCFDSSHLRWCLHVYTTLQHLLFSKLIAS